MRDNKSLLLLLLSAGLIITWGYHLYDKSSYANHPREVLVKDSSAVAKAVSDSLKDFFAHTLDQLDPEKIQIDSATMSSDSVLRQRFNEIRALRTEISNTLKQKDLSQGDIGSVKVKIDTLQKKMIELEKEDALISNESKKSIVETTQPDNAISSQQNKKIEPVENKTQLQKSNDLPVFVASDIRFAAYKVQPDQKVIETTQQDQATKFVSSFTVRNKVAGFQTAEIIVVVSDPSGKSVNPEVWDAGSFETKSEGRKIYTRKLRFEYNKGEAKRLQFSLEPENFEKGIYKLSLYHNGIRIGQSTWKLN